MLATFPIPPLKKSALNSTNHRGLIILVYQIQSSLILKCCGTPPMKSGCSTATWTFKSAGKCLLRTSFLHLVLHVAFEHGTAGCIYHRDDAETHSLNVYSTCRDPLFLFSWDMAASGELNWTRWHLFLQPLLPMTFAFLWKPTIELESQSDEQDSH